MIHPNSIYKSTMNFHIILQPFAGELMPDGVGCELQEISIVPAPFRIIVLCPTRQYVYCVSHTRTLRPYQIWPSLCNDGGQYLVYCISIYLWFKLKSVDISEFKFPPVLSRTIQVCQVLIVKLT